MNIEDIVNKFNTTPFLFIGSGMSRRYLGLPDWNGLLEHFAKIVSNDEFSYSRYKNLAEKSINNKSDLMPKIAKLIQDDFDAKWFSETSIRTVSAETLKAIKNGLSPFKAELCEFIKQNSKLQAQYKDEIDKLRQISNKSISGVITTNYDTFIEDNFYSFKKYVGQIELIFSAIQGIAEIYKIHGSIDIPSSIVINDSDYKLFDEKSDYLAAKLLTIFMEYPIIFIGYSISDNNILNIISSIVNCLDSSQIAMLEDRFIFVEYDPSKNNVEVSPFQIMVKNKPFPMKKITLSDFMPLYCALENKKAKLPVRLLRKFKEELYSYTITNVPTASIRVASIDDKRVADEDLVITIGKASDFGLRGLSGIDGNEWYRDIVLGDIEFSADELLEYAFPKLLKQNSGKLPVNKYLCSATKYFPECKATSESLTFDNIINKTIKKHRSYIGNYTSIKQIWDDKQISNEKATRLMAYLKEDQIDVNELEFVLNELFKQDINILNSSISGLSSNIRRLILVYDYLKWGKKRASYS